MGYRSDVAICWLAEDFRKIGEECEAGKDDEKWSLLKWRDETLAANGGKYTITVWRGVKWYSGDADFPDVALVEELRKSRTSLFVRIGEDYDDIETDRNEEEGDDGETFIMGNFLGVSRDFDISREEK